MKNNASRLLATLMTLSLVCGTLPGLALAADSDQKSPAPVQTVDAGQSADTLPEEGAAKDSPRAEDTDPDEEDPAGKADLAASAAQGLDALDDLSLASEEAMLEDEAEDFDGNGNEN